jgi:hypothetical protein
LATNCHFAAATSSAFSSAMRRLCSSTDSVTLSAKVEQAVREAAAAFDAFMHDADETRAAVLGLEVHHRMEHALAGADDFLVELAELLGRLRGKDVGEGQVRPSSRGTEARGTRRGCGWCGGCGPAGRGR